MGTGQPVRGLVKVKQFFESHTNRISWLCGGKHPSKKGLSGTANWKQVIGNSLASKGFDEIISFTYHQLYLSSQRQESRKTSNAVI